MNNIYLVGFMGTGKTEVGRSLSMRLNSSFVDMDELIESREKLTIPEIFKSKGEPYFRNIEKEIVAEVSGKDDLVVSCGGGTFIDQRTIEKLKQSGTVICLTSSPEMILKRTSQYTHRPLLNCDDPRARIEELLKKREPFYKQAHYTIDADKLTVEATAEKILILLKLR